MTDVGTDDPMAASMERVLEMVGRPGSPLADAALWHVVVLGNEALTEDYCRLTFGGPDLDKFAYRPGQDLMLRIPTSQGMLTHRRYTIRRAERRQRTLDIDVVVHGDGPGARWAANAEPGAELDTIGSTGLGHDLRRCRLASLRRRRDRLARDAGHGRSAPGRGARDRDSRAAPVGRRPWPDL